MFQIPMSYLLTAAVAICAIIGTSLAPVERDLLADESNSLPVAQVRRYANGPLTAADFLADTKPDDSNVAVDAQAYCATDLRWQFRYRVSVQDRVTTVRLDSIDVFAVVLRNESWSARPDDKRLMDHEQGHFDLRHLYALRAQRHFAKLLKAGQPLEGKARTEQLAARALERQINDAFAPFVAELKQAHRRYDEATRHGELPGPQAAQRRQQLDAIRAIVEDLPATAKSAD